MPGTTGNLSKVETISGNSTQLQVSGLSPKCTQTCPRAELAPPSSPLCLPWRMLCPELSGALASGKRPWTVPTSGAQRGLSPTSSPPAHQALFPAGGKTPGPAPLSPL